jgi:hypothetical protein
MNFFVEFLDLCIVAATNKEQTPEFEIMNRKINQMKLY